MTDITKASNLNEVAKTNEEVKATAMAVMPTQDEAVTATAVTPTAETVTSVSESNTQAEADDKEYIRELHHAKQAEGLEIETEGTDKVAIWLEKNHGSKKATIVVQVASADGEEEELLYTTRDRVIKGEKTLDFLCDLDCLDVDFDIEAVKKKIFDIAKNDFAKIPRRTIYDKASFKFIYTFLCRLVHEADEFDKDTIGFDKHGRCRIESGEFDRIIAKYFTGVKAVEVKRWLLNNGKLLLQGHGYTCKFRRTAGYGWAIVFEDCLRGEYVD